MTELAPPPYPPLPPSTLPYPPSTLPYPLQTPLLPLFLVETFFWSAKLPEEYLPVGLCVSFLKCPKKEKKYEIRVICPGFFVSWNVCSVWEVDQSYQCPAPENKHENCTMRTFVRKIPILITNIILFDEISKNENEKFASWDKNLPTSAIKYFYGTECHQVTFLHQFWKYKVQ